MNSPFYRKFNTVREMKKFSQKTDHHFFDDDAMRFFNSTIYTPIYHGKGEENWNYFVTSEYYEEGWPKLYSVRRMLEDGDTETVGEFQQYESFEDAEAAILELIEERSHE